MDQKACEYGDCLEVARQFNLIRDELSKYSSDDVVYDMNSSQKRAPWEGKISPVVTSCANIFTSTDGEDLLSGIVAACVYAYYARKRIEIVDE